jgi:hypothetical protein
MPRKKKEKPMDDSDQYNVLIGYVHEFNYKNPRYESIGHPLVGRVYRLIKDPGGYRLHIGRENNPAGLDGIFLGETLVGDRPDYSFNIEAVTPESYLTLKIHKQDYDAIMGWIESDNSDLWSQLQKETSGESPVIKNLNDLMKLIASSEPTPNLPIPKKAIGHIAKDHRQKANEEHYDVAERISNALNMINIDMQMMYGIADLLELVAETYTTPREKDVYYATKGIHNLMGELKQRIKE